VYETRIKKLVEIHNVSFFKAPQRALNPVVTMQGHEKIELLVGGKVNFPYKGKSICFGKGAMFWHTEGQYTIFENHIDNPYQCIVIEFIVKNKQGVHIPRVSRWADPDQAVSFAFHLFETFKNRVFSKSFLGFYAYSRLLIEAERAARNDLLVEPWPPALRNAVNFIESNYTKPILLSEIASNSEISIPYLHKLFSEHLRKSPHRIILELRMKKARQYLTESLIHLREIAVLSGFGTAEYFCRIFAQEHGMPPMVYRRTYAIFRDI